MSETLIDAYTHCPICGSPDYGRMGGRRRCDQCGHVDFNNPITAVAVWILDDGGRALLIGIHLQKPVSAFLARPFHT